MIHFFRKIRKKIAEDNKPRKYLRYALGEILLVVIGILIALQVNNWNEDRKRLSKKEFYLKSLFLDYQEDIEYLEDKNTTIAEQINFMDSLSKRLGNKEATLDTILRIAKEEISLMYHSYSKLNENTYNTLQVTGHFDYLEPWLQETIQELNFMHIDLYDTSRALSEDIREVTKNFLKVYPRNSNAKIISESIGQIVNNKTSNIDKISSLNSILWIKGGAYYSMLKRAKLIEDKTCWLIDTLQVAFPYLKEIETQ